MTDLSDRAAAMDSRLEQELRAILDTGSLTSWFQPIVDFPGRTILGYEALARGPQKSPLHRPAKLFATAESCGLLRELEQLCIATAIQHFSELKLPGKLFLNIAAADLGQLDNPDSPIGCTLAKYTHQINIVLEVSEKYPLVDYDRIREISDYCHQRGLQMAIDDLDSGYSGLRTWAKSALNT